MKREITNSMHCEEKEGGGRGREEMEKERGGKEVKKRRIER